jgi:hypothetical protein
MIFFKPVLLILVLAISPIFLTDTDAATELSNTLGGSTISSDRNNLLVKDTVTIPDTRQTDKAKWLLPTAKAATITGVGALCAMAYYLHQKSENVSLYRNAKSQNERKEYYENQKPLSRNAIITGIAGGLMISAGGYLFVLDNNRKKGKQVAVTAIVGWRNGFLAMIDF